MEDQIQGDDSLTNKLYLTNFTRQKGIGNFIIDSSTTE